MVNKKPLLLVFLIIITLISGSAYALEVSVGPGWSFHTLSGCLKYINGTTNSCSIKTAGDYVIEKWMINASQSDFYNRNDDKLILAFDFDVYDYPNEYDLSGEPQNDAILVGNPSWSSNGLYGNAYEFNGVNQYGIVYLFSSGNILLSENLALEVWAKPNSFNGNTYFMGKRNDYRLGVNGSGNIIFEINNTSGNHYDCYSTTALNTGQWYHIVGNYNSTNLQIYINGMLDNQCTASGRPRNSGSSLGIASTTPSYTNRFNGTIDQLRIWNTSLTKTGIEHRYAGIDDYYGDSSTGSRIEISTSNINVYCNGTGIYSVTPSSTATRAFNVVANNARIDGCNFKNWHTGIELLTNRPQNAIITNNYFENYPVTDGQGIEIRTDNALVENNNMLYGNMGIRVYGGNNSVIRNNTIVNVSIGLDCYTGFNNTFTDNYVVNNSIVSFIMEPGGVPSTYNKIGRNVFKGGLYSIWIAATYHYNNTFWLNHILRGQFFDPSTTPNIYCYNGEGNFYDESQTLYIPSNDCGIGILNNVTTSTTTTVYPITWSKQSALTPVTYDVYVKRGVVETYIGSTASLSTSYDFSAYINKTVRMVIIPWINGSRYNGTEFEGSLFYVPDLQPSPPLPTPTEQCQETRTMIFLGFSLLALIAVVGAAFAIVMVIQGNADAFTLIVLVASFIGLAIILFVGYIAIGYVGAWVCF